MYGWRTAIRRFPGYATTLSGRCENARVQEDVAAPGGDGFYRGLAYGGGSLWLSQIVGGDIANADAVTRIDLRQVRSGRSTSHAPHRGLRGRAGTATCGSTTSTTEASRDCSRRREQRQPSTASPPRPPFRSSTETPSGSETGRRRKSSASVRSDPPGPTGSPCRGHGRRMERRGRCGRRVGDDSSQQRAVANRSEDEQRDPREPPLPADRRRRGRRRCLGDGARTVTSTVRSAGH